MSQISSECDLSSDDFFGKVWINLFVYDRCLIQRISVLNNFVRNIWGVINLFLWKQVDLVINCIVDLKTILHLYLFASFCMINECSYFSEYY